MAVAHQGGALPLETLPGRRARPVALDADPRSAPGNHNPVATVQLEAPGLDDQEALRRSIDRNQFIRRGCRTARLKGDIMLPGGVSRRARHHRRFDEHATDRCSLSRAFADVAQRAQAPGSKIDHQRCIALD